MIKYAASKGRVAKTIAGENLLIPVGETVMNRNSVITLNSTAAFIWSFLSEPHTEDEIVSAILESYDTDEPTARNDVREALERFTETLSVVKTDA